MSKAPSRASVNSAPGNAKSRANLQSSSVSNFSADYEEFASLQLDKPSEGELKSSDDMKRHLFDDHFEGRPIERAMHLLAVGEEVQKLSVIRQLLQLIQADEQGCMQRVFPKIQQALNTASTEFHIETAKAFSTILEKRAISNNAFTQAFLPSILFHLDNRDQVVSNAWLDTLLEVSDTLPVDIIKREILQVAINKGQISQSVWHRVAACKLLGKMCTRFDQQTIKKDILPVVHSLCQDVNEAVRACICSQLHFVAKGLPPDMVKPALIPILVELGRDETVQVRVEATETIVHMIPFLNQEVLKVTIIPLVKKICEQAVLAMDDTLVMVAKQFGSLCLGLEASLTPNDKLWMVTYFHNVSHLGIPSHGAKKDIYFTSHNMDRINARYIECRQLCAYNFPAMSKFCNPSPELLDKLYPSFCDFATDPYYMVRKTIGCGMHEVARILGPNNRIVKNQVLTLLWDNMEEVLMGIVPHLGRIIDLLISSGAIGHDQDGATVELGRGLLQCDKTIREKTHNWRLHTDFITQLESIVKCLPNDYIYTQFVSLMFDKMHKARPLPCRLAAARTLLVFLRYNVKNNQRQEIRSRIQAEFCMSTSCYKRMLFLRLCMMAREIFSRSYFKEHFFLLLLSRAEDKVPNNRLLLVRQFPYLKGMIVLPQERKYLQTLETTIRNMASTESDKDVTAELKISVAKLDKTDTLTENPTMPTLEDIEDKKKLDEEIKLANIVAKPTGAAGTFASLDSRRAPPKPADKSYASAAASTPRNTQTGREQSATPSRPVSQTPPLSGSANLQNPVNNSSGALLTPLRSNYGSGQQQSQSQQQATLRKSPANFPETVPPSSMYPVQQSFTNSTNIYPLRTSLALLDTNNHQNCTCFSNFRSDYLRNLNLRALIDTNLEKSDLKIPDSMKQRITADLSNKMRGSCKSNMEISWLNLETDLKKELFTLAKGGKIHGDRNFKEKNNFLSDFRNFNESSLGKFINNERDYKETIYNVRGDLNHYNARSNFFEERINFFERKVKLDDGKTNPDCSCFDLTTNRFKYPETNENRKFSYFSKSFEQDFYRDAGVKAHEIIGRKMSGIPISSHQMSSPKMTSTVANRRRTWFGEENVPQNGISLEALFKFLSENDEKLQQRKKSETLPLRESISLEKIGIGPRSKSFVLPSTLIFSEKPSGNHQSTKLFFDKNIKSSLRSETLKTDSLEKKNYFNSMNNSCTNNNNNNTNIKNSNNNNQGAVRKLRSETDGNRFGFRQKSRERSPKAETKPLPKTKIPVGRGSNSSSPNSSRSASPIFTTAKEKNENGKKIPVVSSRKSLLILSNTQKTDVRMNRRSLDSSKINIANMGKSVNKVYGKKEEEVKGRQTEDKPEVDHVSNTGSSKLPVRKQKPPDK